MEEYNIEKVENAEDEKNWAKFEKSHRRGKIMGGILVVTAGALFLARELGVAIPFWVFSWKMILIGLGLVLAVRHKFLHPGWFILIAVGSAFLLTDIYPDMQIKPILWPSLIILFGLFIIFKPRRKHNWKHMRDCRRLQHHYRNKYHHRYQKDYHQGYQSDFSDREEAVKDDFIDSTAIMAGVKKNILTKNFKGGEITNVFGGAEINLTQADFEGKVNLEITQVFGGTKLVVPANWEIRSEVTVTIFGSIEDKRASYVPASGEPTKVLVITGTTIFGGIDIRSF